MDITPCYKLSFRVFNYENVREKALAEGMRRLLQEVRYLVRGIKLEIIHFRRQVLLRTIAIHYTFQLIFPPFVVKIFNNFFFDSGFIYPKKRKIAQIKWGYIGGRKLKEG